MEKWERIPSDSVLEKTAAALKQNGIEASVASNGGEALKRLLSLIPPGAQVMNMTSATLDSIGAIKEVVDSGKFDSVRNRFAKMDPKAQAREMRQLGAAPEVAIGSVHAVTQDGKVLVVSASGSQLPAYAYGAPKVIWVVGAQKIVKDFNEGLKRIEEEVFPWRTRAPAKCMAWVQASTSSWSSTRNSSRGACT